MADDPTDGNGKDRNAPTVRELKGPGVPTDTLPDVVGVYVPPHALPEVAQHRTMDLKSVRLSDYVDSRRALTERRLVSPPRQEPEHSRSGLWFVAACVLALVAGAWFLLQEPTSTSVAEESDPGMVSAPAPTEARSAPTVASATPTVVAAPITVPEPLPSVASEPKVEEKPSAPAPAKTQRPRAAEKKRKDPWLD